MIALIGFVACQKDNSPDDNNSNNNSFSLDKNVDGKDLTKDFCINLVQNYWDCSNGAVSIRGTSSGDYITKWDCSIQGAKGYLLNGIDNYFDKIDREGSYYKYRILTLIFDYSDGSGQTNYESLIIYFE